MRSRTVPQLGCLFALAACDCSAATEESEGAPWPGYRLVRTVGGSGQGEGRMRVPMGVGVDAQGRLYVADAGNRRVQRFAADGAFERLLGAGALIRPVDVTVDPDGTVWVADMGADRIRCFEADGSEQPERSIEVEAPTALALRSDGAVVAALFGGHGVVELARIDPPGAGGPRLERRVAVGGRGAGPGQFRHPTDVAALSDGGVLVADADNGRIQRLDARGRATDVWSGPPDHGFEKPAGVSIGDGVVHVADAVRRSVLALDEKGRLLAEWSLTDDADRTVESPVRVETRDGLVYVTDAANDRVLVLEAAPSGT